MCPKSSHWEAEEGVFGPNHAGPEAQSVLGLCADRVSALNSDFPACPRPSCSVLDSELWSWARDGPPSCRRASSLSGLMLAQGPSSLSPPWGERCRAEV